MSLTRCLDRESRDGLTQATGARSILPRLHRTGLAFVCAFVILSSSVGCQHWRTTGGSMPDSRRGDSELEDALYRERENQTRSSESSEKKKKNWFQRLLNDDATSTGFDSRAKEIENRLGYH